MTTPTKFNVGLIQMAVSPQPKENLARASAKIEEAARGGAQVVCLPELFQSQYFCQSEDTANFDLAEAIPGPTTEALGRVAQKAKVVLVA
ncbi:MAG: nitrilase-related carbon-nitrogen hydrolase, partial [Candidatus Acidiferrales bacterium]